MTDSQFRNIIPSAAEKTAVTPHDSGIRNKDDKIDPEAFRKKLEQKRTDTENRKKQRHHLEEGEATEIAKRSPEKLEESKDPSPYAVQKPEKEKSAENAPPPVEKKPEETKETPFVSKTIDPDKAFEEESISLSIDDKEVEPTSPKESSPSPEVLETTTPKQELPVEEIAPPKEEPSIEKPVGTNAPSMQEEPAVEEKQVAPVNDPPKTEQKEPVTEEESVPPSPVTTTEAQQEKEILKETPIAPVSKPLEPTEELYTEETKEPIATEEVKTEEDVPVENKESLEEATSAPVETTEETTETDNVEETEEKEPVSTSHPELEKGKEIQSEEGSEESSSTQDVFEKPLEEAGDGKGEGDDTSNQSAPAQLFSFAPGTSSSTGVISPHFVSLPSEVLELFERMVGTVTVLEMMQNKTETTIDLTSEQFKSSIFFGSKITIVEFAQAPKVYNISFEGSPEAVALFNKHKEQLEESFKEEEKSFSVHLLEASLLQNQSHGDTV